MTQEQSAHATEVVYRTDKARSRQNGGAVLGLALVEQIADAHGAELTIDSAIGLGTTVRIEFTNRGYRTAGLSPSSLRQALGACRCLGCRMGLGSHTSSFFRGR